MGVFRIACWCIATIWGGSSVIGCLMWALVKVTGPIGLLLFFPIAAAAAGAFLFVEQIVRKRRNA